MPDGWVDAVLGDVADITIGRTPPRDEPRYWTTDLTRPFCTIADMDGGVIVPRREGVTEAAEVDGRAKRMSAGSLLLSFKLTIGRVGIAGVDLFPNEAIARIEPKTASLDKHFLALWLSATDLTSGAGRAVKGNTLNSTSLRAIPVSCPPLAEQRRIVDLISAVEGALSGAELVAARASAALAAACIEATDVTVASTTARLSDVAAILDSRRIPVSEAERVTRQGEVPYYGANGQVGWIDRPLFDEPLVLVAEDGGRYEEWRSRTVAYEISGPAWVNNHAHVLRATGVPHDWLYYSLRHRDLTPVVNHGTRSKLNQAPLRDLPIAIVDEPERLTALLRVLEEVAASAQRSAAVLVGLRSALLGRLLSVDHEIPDSYDRFLDVVA